MSKTQKNSLGNIKIYLIAAKIGNLEVVKNQIESGLVDINYRSCEGYSALHIAAMFDQREVIKYLIKNNINMNITDMRDKTFLDYLAFNPFLNE